MFRIVALCALVAILAACTATPAVISDLETDKVKVQAGLGTSDEMVAAKAGEGCAMHDRVAQRISFVCLDQYCIRSEHLFACLEQ